MSYVASVCQGTFDVKHTQASWACVEMRTYSRDCSGMRPQTYAGFADNERACHDRVDRMTWTSQLCWATSHGDAGCLKQLLLTCNSQHFRNQCTRAEVSQGNTDPAAACQLCCDLSAHLNYAGSAAILQLSYNLSTQVQSVSSVVYTQLICDLSTLAAMC